MQRKAIAIYGSTGSIGTQTLKIAEQLDRFNVVALVGRSNTELLEQQIRKFKPLYAGMTQEDKVQELKKRVSDTSTEIVSGVNDSIAICATNGINTVVNSWVGVAGLEPTLKFLVAGKNVALANKESLVVGGRIVMRTAKKYGVRVLPIDSEHSAIWQCIQGEHNGQIEKLIITASGGPFRESPIESFIGVTPAQALNHPTWPNMGKRITIDSATLMNKGFEVIEASVLFGIDPKNIEVAIHPNSIVHSFVQFKDGVIKAQLGVPDMGAPIQYALTFPNRAENQNLPRLEIKELSLKFELPNMNRFQCLGLAFEALRIGGVATAVLNGADERSVSLFLDGKIGYLDIPRLVGGSLREHKHLSKPNLSHLMRADKWAREYVDRNAWYQDPNEEASELSLVTNTSDVN